MLCIWCAPAFKGINVVQCCSVFISPLMQSSLQPENMTMLYYFGLENSFHKPYASDYSIFSGHGGNLIWAIN